MPMGGTSQSVALARRLRQRWLDEPSPPLAVDDEPLWSPAPDSVGDRLGAEDDLEAPGSAPAV
jgi:hypothetical protein